MVFSNLYTEVQLPLELLNDLLEEYKSLSTVQELDIKQVRHFITLDKATFFSAIIQ